MKKTSKALSLNREDLISAGRGLAIALAGVILTYLQSLSFDFGDYTPLAVAINSVVINILRLWLQNNKN